MTSEQIDRQVEEIARAIDGGVVLAKIAKHARSVENPDHIIGLTHQQCADLIFLIDNARQGWKNGL